MSDCIITIETDKDEPHYVASEPITGKVRVLVSDTKKAVTCDGLKLSLRFETKGKGGDYNEELLEEILFTGTWEAGEFVYPFSLVAPGTHEAYEGALFRTSLHLLAEADIPWAFDPSATKAVAIARPPQGQTVVTWNAEAYMRSSSGCLIISVVLVAIGVAIFYWNGWMSDSDWNTVAGALIILALIGFFSSIRDFLADRSVGDVGIEIAQAKMGGYRKSGGDEGLVVTLKVDATAAIQHAVAKLVVREEATTGAGSNRRRKHEHVVAAERIDLARGRPGQYLGSLEIPLDTAPCPFSCGYHAVVWELQLEVDLPRRPDWKQSIPLIVKRCDGRGVGRDTADA